ncbi:MAG: alpha-galactosidase [Bacteroidetes bacterium GWF2_42_66]|nr:MAG: alpha-galactosidase [Bacteroidetes bacterium GWA2_42_15]OFX99791.1 MAG: alpha-galactosidase [Bacteroidetes bacterium GWE2_42_39]OFY46645.1 MAG: alpha-galactosidase [Bacteroidetes bacterium GWF2_42_66]HBL74771.1 alpha-galactosidase [Prolixibacteraceae bacterium]HCR92281.1 alpha-galactosidase [Prolixibacteraceae bacterium]
MKKIISLILVIVITEILSQCISPVDNTNKKTDWLIDNSRYVANIDVSEGGKDIVINNGLVKRTFRLKPNVACTSYENLVNNQQLLRAVKPEAELVINGKKYNVGGLYGQKEHAYLLPEWIDNFTSDENDFQYVSYSESEIEPYINWKQTFWAGKNSQPSGKRLTFLYHSKNHKGIEVAIHYELYDGLPLIVKWLSIKNGSKKSVEIGKVVNEKLALVEEESAVVGSSEEMKKQHGIYLETNYAFNNAMRYDISDQTTHWKTDSVYTSQVNYSFQTPCLLEVYPEKVTAVTLSPGESFKSVRTHELLMDSYDRERRGLAIRKMYRIVVPWTNQNPIFMHLVSRNDEEVKNAISQCAATGYEALILSFGSHCNMEDTTETNIEKWKELARIAHENGIKIGGYSLFSSRRISDEDDVIDPVTGKPNAAAFFGHAPCLGSKWGLAYVEKLKYFMKETDFTIFENDGPYPGDVCASATHPGHSGLGDSQWKQMEMQKALYRWCNENGIYVNAPDWYFMDGTHKIALGYREVNFSLPRDQQKILNRQNIFDGTWEKTPSMSWGFVPLTRYQGGGEEVVLEPLSEHLNDYEQLMVQYYGAGIQACYRGPRLFDTEETKQLVIRVIDWYKKHREVLNSDIIHLRRADGRDWDGFLHVNPTGEEKGLLMLFNPLNILINKEIKIPVYYTGLSEKVKIGEKDGKTKIYPINRDYTVLLPVTIPAKGYNWFILK